VAVRRCAAIVAVLAAGCAHDAAEEVSAPVPVRCIAGQLGEVDDTLSLRGRLTLPPGGDLSVASQVAGRVVEVLAREGQRIAMGDAVARVEGGASRDALRQAEAAVDQARATEQNANTTLDRTKALVARGIAAKQELEDAVARAEAGRAGVSSANAAADLARRTLGRVEVRSSFAGVVTKIWRGPGAIVDGTAATPIVQLAASGGTEFVGETTTAELVSVVGGQLVTGTLLDGRAAFEGTVRVRALALDPTTGLGTVRIAVNPGDAGAPELPLGAFGRAVITLGRRKDVLLVPLAALRGAVADGSEVVVCKDGKASLRAVHVGWRGPQTIEVAGGLAPGELVAVDHVLGLEDGTAIVEAK
jgi:RND family efflux transporter MFP subunit